MSKTASKQCPNCGLHHALVTAVCGCGTALSTVIAKEVDTEVIPQEKLGTLKPDARVFVQVCPACGTLSFTHDASQGVKLCYSCGKARIRTVKPVEYTEPKSEADGKEAEAKIDIPNGDEALDSILESVKKTTDEVTASEDDEAAVTWGAFIEGKKTKAKIILSPAFHSKDSATLTEDECPCLLGRSACLAETLAVDGRVSNRHCYIEYKDGVWSVRDNNSANGTFVNYRDIGLGGVCELKTGDVLILGHESDSFTFRVSIE